MATERVSTYAYHPDRDRSSLDRWLEPSGLRRYLLVVTILLLVGLVVLSVRAVGGMPHTHAHLMYVPIAIAAVIFGLKGGVIIGLIAGLLIGPVMPADIATGEPQILAQWLERLAAFIAVGAISGLFRTKLRDRTEGVEWLAYHDPVTGIPNRRAMREIIEKQITTTETDQVFAVVVLSINNLAEIIHTFGSEFADRVLAAFVERLASKLHSGYPPCQLESSWIVAVVPQQFARRSNLLGLREIARRPFLIEKVPIYIDISIGRAYFPKHAKDPEELLTKASIAMHQAVESGRQDAVYDIRFDNSSQTNLSLLASVPDALEANHFDLMYQPVYALGDDCADGVEALIRWNDPERGSISPAAFIPQLEKTHLIQDVTTWVIRHALDDLKEWQDNGVNARLAVNVSAKNLSEPRFPELLDAMVGNVGMDRSNLELEVTESAIMANPEEAIRSLHAVREIGVTVAIDDFGTGQTALAYLGRMPFDTLKIDQYFVRRMNERTVERNLVVALIQLAREFGWNVVAEGVEDKEALEALKRLGCPHIQGYYISRPMYAEDAYSFMNASA